MSEHDFAIRLFIAATAIAVLGVAVTQAGWTQRRFVQALFGLSAGLFIAALYWPQIAPHVPTSVDVNLGAISASLVSWLLLLAITVGAICGLDCWARLRWAKHFPRVVELLENKELSQPQIEAPSTITPDTRQWLSSYKIFELADPILVQRTAQLANQLQKLEEEISANTAEQSALSPKDVHAALEAMRTPLPALEILKKNASELYDKNRTAAANHRAVFGDLLEDIYDKLANGKLIAKGFLVPVETDSSEIEIPAAHWRLIRFHAVGYTQAEGQGIKYVGITVTRA